MTLLDTLLNLATSARVRLWLRLRYPQWFTTGEIASGIPVITRVRVQQIVQTDFENGLVKRRRRETGKPGPSPYEYSVSPALFTDFTEEELDSIRTLS